METTTNKIHPDSAAPVGEAQQPNVSSRSAHRSGRPDDDVVRRSEFKLALWVGGFALAAILSGQGFLYAAIMDLQGGMQTQIGGMQTQINELRKDMQTQFADLRERVHELSERVARVETRLGMVAAPPTDRITDFSNLSIL